MNSKGGRVNWIKKRKGIEKVGMEVKTEVRDVVGTKRAKPS